MGCINCIKFLTNLLIDCKFKLRSRCYCFHFIQFVVLHTKENPSSPILLGSVSIKPMRSCCFLFLGD